MFTLNFAPTLCFGGSNALIWHDFAGFWDWSGILEEKNCSGWQLHDERSRMESAGSGSLFFSRKPFVSYRT